MAATPVVVASYGPTGARRAIVAPDGAPVRLDDACALGMVHQRAVLDLDIELTAPGRSKLVARVVCVPCNGIDRWYITTLPREIFTAHDVAEIYRVRWEIELYFRHWRGSTRLDEVRRLKDPVALEVAVLSSLPASMLSHEIHDALDRLGAEDSIALPPVPDEAAFPPWVRGLRSERPDLPGHADDTLGDTHHGRDSHGRPGLCRAGPLGGGRSIEGTPPAPAAGPSQRVTAPPRCAASAHPIRRRSSTRSDVPDAARVAARTVRPRSRRKPVRTADRAGRDRRSERSQSGPPPPPCDRSTAARGTAPAHPPAPPPDAEGASKATTRTPSEASLRRIKETGRELDRSGAISIANRFCMLIPPLPLPLVNPPVEEQSSPRIVPQPSRGPEVREKAEKTWWRRRESNPGPQVLNDDFYTT